MQQDKLKEILNIVPGSECLEFLVKRIQSNNYRGIQISQHNRYTLDDIFIILENIYKISEKELLQIRDTDLSRRPNNTPGEKKYALLTINIAKEMGRCTQDSLRKNIFVDMHRMGLIYRYDRNKEIIAPFKRRHVKYISLTPLAIELIESNASNRIFLYTRAIETLMNGYGEELLFLISELDKNTIELNEIVLFASFIDQSIDNHTYVRSEIADYLKEYQTFSKFIKKHIVLKIKEYCNPDNFGGNKVQQRDWHNWVNEAQQIMYLLGQTAYFENRDSKLIVRIGKTGIYEDTAKLKRSVKEKELYFEKHGVKKELGFELHHIVPLCWAKKSSDFLLFDNWQNLAYIDGKSHSKISQQNNRHVVLSFECKDAIFTDFNKDRVVCKIDENIIYSPKKQKTMLEYNKQILDAI